MKKTILVVLGTLALSVSALADSNIEGYDMETIVDCQPAHLMMDTGYSFKIRHARIGSEMDAVFSQFFLGHRNVTRFTDVQILDQSVSTEIFTAPIRNGELKLEINRPANATSDAAPATLTIGNETYEMTCQHLMMAL